MFHKHFPANTYFISDLHLNHKNICKSVSNWNNKENCRDFPSVEAMNTAIIDSINNTVGKNDHLFHLGDFLFGHRDKLLELRNRINCKNIYHIFGNHCDKIRFHSDLNKCFKWYGDYLEIFIEGKLICLFHYPINIWRDVHQDSYCICGHSHGTFENSLASCTNKGKVLDVGWDCFKKPLDFSQIRSIMDTKSFTQMDHHNKSTT